MIIFDKLWITMKQKNVSQYQLIKAYGFSTEQLDRLRKNQNVNSYTLNTLCEILDCKLEDIAEYKKDQEKQTRHSDLTQNDGSVYIINIMKCTSCLK